MCFTSGPTTDERGSRLTDGLRAKLLQITKTKGNKSKTEKLPGSRLPKGAPQFVSKVAGLTKKASPARTDFKGSPSRSAFNRLGSTADVKGMQNTEAMTNSLSPKGVGPQRFVSISGAMVPKDARSERPASNSHTGDSKGVVRSDRPVGSSEDSPKGVRSERFTSNYETVPVDVHSERLTGDSGSLPKLDKKTFISAQFIAKINAKQMKGVMKGVGKEFRRAASTVGEKLPNYPTKKSKEERERLELLKAEPQKPQVRNADEIKKAYGHAPAVDANQAAMITRDKLHERGEKLSAMQRRTTELEADAGNFNDLAHELVKKMETKKKWYEFN